MIIILFIPEEHQSVIHHNYGLQKLVINILSQIELT